MGTPAGVPVPDPVMKGRQGRFGRMGRGGRCALGSDRAAERAELTAQAAGCLVPGQEIRGGYGIDQCRERPEDVDGAGDAAGTQFEDLGLDTVRPTGRSPTDQLSEDRALAGPRGTLDDLGGAGLTVLTRARAIPAVSGDLQEFCEDRFPPDKDRGFNLVGLVNEFRQSRPVQRHQCKSLLVRARREDSLRAIRSSTSPRQVWGSGAMAKEQVPASAA